MVLEPGVIPEVDLAQRVGCLEVADIVLNGLDPVGPDNEI
jgi:hypothetical protein